MNSSSIPSFPFTSDASPKTKISTGTQTFLTINDFSNISSTDALMSNDDYVNKFFNSSNTPIEESIGNKKNGKSLKTAIKTDAFELFRKEYIKSNPEKEEKDIVEELLKTSMENAMKLKVPLKVELSEADDWYEAK